MKFHGSDAAGRTVVMTRKFLRPLSFLLATLTFLAGNAYGIPSFAGRRISPATTVTSFSRGLMPSADSSSLTATPSRESSPSRRREAAPRPSRSARSCRSRYGPGLPDVPSRAGARKPELCGGISATAELLPRRRNNSLYRDVDRVTYEDESRSFVWDSTDIRFALAKNIGGKRTIFGLTLNNGPTVQDVWNTTPAWSFPFGRRRGLRALSEIPHPRPTQRPGGRTRGLCPL